MNGVPDSHKRTSISQLLNPLASSSAHDSAYPPNVQLPSLSGSGPPFQQAQHLPQGPYSSNVEPGSPFHLRAASWDHVADEQSMTKRKPDSAVATSSRPYVVSQPNYLEYHDHGDRQMRPRIDESGNYSIPNAAWPPPPEMVNMPYGSPVIAPMYSDERTALSGDYAAHNAYNRNYQEPQQQQQQQEQHARPSSLQTTERASVRLAARGSAMDMPPPGLQRYNMQPHFFPAPPQFTALVLAHPAPLPAQPPPQAQKRASVEVEEATGSKAKKAKTKSKAPADGTSKSSKRGYNAKKRSEAQIAAQNAQLMPTVSYTQVTDSGNESAGEASMRIVTADNGHPDPTASLQTELQFARCMSNRYRSEQFPRCVSCTRRWAGDTCRFQGIRFFLRDAQGNIMGISFVETQRADGPSMNFPTKWNVPLEPRHIRRTKRTIARALLPTLRRELDHLNLPEIIRRTRESEVRATCDTCMTSIFSSSWMCRLCGREACAECFEQVKELTEDRPGAPQAEIAALQVRRERHAHSNPFFLSCTRRNEHHAKDFSPMSRFCKDELAQAIKDMEALIAGPDPDELPKPNAAPIIGAIDPALEDKRSSDSQAQMHAADAGARSRNAAATTTSSTESSSRPAAGGEASASDMPISGPAAADASLPPPDLPSVATSVIGIDPTGATPTDLPCHPTIYIADADLTDDIFRPLWSKGNPIVVTGLLPKFKVKWTPDYFMEKYNPHSCLILECQSDVNKRVTVGEFFSWFGKYDDRKERWKLKDWPPSTDFRTAFPELFEDFNNAVPVPDYVRRDGALNIASHFPSNTVAPDLGPKMYNAMASFESAGSKGSTRLHMDMADAINIMTFATSTPEGKPGCAAWDLFRAEDAEKLRQFMKKKFKGSYQHDPIHSQQFYLDTQLRRELHEMYGVKSYRIYQKPGEAVFIPAGCAHQVCNLADCIKVAVDFVSPENIARCEQLTGEFREQNQSMVWKEDVLQLRTMMWFAWLSCCKQEKEMNEP